MPVFEDTPREELVDSLLEGLAARRSSAFNKIGVSGCLIHVHTTLDALERDLEAGARDRMREAAATLMRALLPEGLSFSDLATFVRSLRERARALCREDARAQVEDWCFEYFSVATRQFIAARDEREQDRAAQREIERYSARLAELEAALSANEELLELVRQASVPIAPITAGVLLVSLVGPFDRERAGLLRARLLEAVSQRRTHSAILDVSGVPVFDLDAARMIVSVARSARLLGARVILVGISAESARTLVTLGVELGGLLTHATLEHGLREALS